MEGRILTDAHIAVLLRFQLHSGRIQTLQPKRVSRRMLSERCGSPLLTATPLFCAAVHPRLWSQRRTFCACLWLAGPTRPSFRAHSSSSFEASSATRCTAASSRASICGNDICRRDASTRAISSQQQQCTSTRNCGARNRVDRGADSPSCFMFDHFIALQAEQHPWRELRFPRTPLALRPASSVSTCPTVHSRCVCDRAMFPRFQGGVFSQEITEIVGASCSGKTQVSFRIGRWHRRRALTKQRFSSSFLPPLMRHCVFLYLLRLPAAVCANRLPLCCGWRQRGGDRHWLLVRRESRSHSSHRTCQVAWIGQWKPRVCAVVREMRAAICMAPQAHAVRAILRLLLCAAGHAF